MNSDLSARMVDNPRLVPTTYARRHVFLDIDNLIEWGQNIYQRFPQPDLLPTTGLGNGSRGSWDARSGCAYGTVLHEDGLFRMWSGCMPGIASLEEGADTWLSSYKESQDGLNWVKPDLGITGQQVRSWLGHHPGLQARSGHSAGGA